MTLPTYVLLFTIDQPQFAKKTAAHLNVETAVDMVLRFYFI